MLIYEDNVPKKIWDYYIVLVILIMAIRKPYYMALLADQEPKSFLGLNLFVWQVLVEVTFCIDMVVTFFATYYDKEKCKLIEDHREIAQNYIRGWFWVDLLTVFPFGLVMSQDT